MEKLLATLVLIGAVWFMLPHLRKGEWLAPAPLPNGWWGSAYGAEDYTAMATSPSDIGWFHFDFWNDQSPDGRPL